MSFQIAYPKQGREHAASIHRAIRASTGGFIRELNVETESDRVVVTGKTSSYYHKQLVTRAVHNLISEDTLHNNIQVSSRTPR
ncbi:BON domain-containing protein [Rubinisphaera sp. JC750]|uniref:BON domain-containing protein n=1 Tax=Rubinisphaera sp. JC750 TaxID=2898658 RepID=UPI001F2FED18|nr:BON domain-containing protein [Rubinisphaera sp. JC750]